MEYSEFRKKVVKAKEKHHFEITNSYGTKEAWRWLKKSKWLDLPEPVTEREFGLILKAINLALRDHLLNGGDIELPHRMGRIEIRKFNAKIEIRDGKLITTLPPDWGRTLELWYEDKDSFENKTIVRFEGIERFSFFYNRTKANFNNKAFYRFVPSRTLKKELKKRIVNGTMDAFLLAR